METKGDELDSSDDKLLTHALKDQIIKGHEDSGLAYHDKRFESNLDEENSSRTSIKSSSGIVDLILDQTMRRKEKKAVM
jgi:hypothetical protein